MNKQITLSALTDELGETSTLKKEFLQQIDRIIPWSEWIGIMELHYYKGERGNKPYNLDTPAVRHMKRLIFRCSCDKIMKATPNCWRMVQYILL